MQDSVTVEMAAPIQRVWDLVSDVTRIGEFSPETFEAEWLRGATGPAKGNLFRGHVKRNQKGPIYWSVCKVTDCEPVKVFAFAVMGKGLPINNWRYDLEPTANGTRVTESFALADRWFNRIYWTLLGRFRGKTNRDGMLTTLERIRVVAENE